MAEAKLLKTRTGVLKRNVKDLVITRREIERENARLQKMTADGAESGRLRQQQHVIEECTGLVPDCYGRITSAIADLEDLLSREEITSAEGVVDPAADIDLVRDANAALEEARALAAEDDTAGMAPASVDPADGSAAAEGSSATAPVAAEDQGANPDGPAGEEDEHAPEP
eukprot:TRINITY_DN8693_c0_g3_i1.p1 TRINITY_DN8693_c0_g3~~TRINITY_DN8693_c0_g3_i1.p1  ORF type:complete len:170 (-),score=32.57 TRINITY_DN8693_c0_g3_i1:143-652(-)